MTDHITIPRALLEQALAALTHEGHFPWANKQYFVEAIRAELAKPVQKVDQNWNMSIRDSVDALLAEAGYKPDSSARHQLAMMNFDQKAQSTPAWHDAPTRPGLWFNSINHYADIVSQHWIDRGVVANSHARWYGPIPQDKEGGAA